MFPLQFSYAVGIRFAQPNGQLGEPLIIRNVDGVESSALERGDSPSVPGDAAHLLNRFQRIGKVHQEGPTTCKIRPAINYWNLVGIALAKGDLVGHSFFLGLFLGSADVGCSNVDSNDCALAGYEASKIPGGSLLFRIPRPRFSLLALGRGMWSAFV